MTERPIEPGIRVDLLARADVLDLVAVLPRTREPDEGDAAAPQLDLQPGAVVRRAD